MSEKYVIDGFSFQNASDYERAKKEKETIAYLSANTDMTDMKAVYKIYKLSLKKKSFQTIFGLAYLEDLRGRLAGSGIVTEEMLEPIPTGRLLMVIKQKQTDTAGKAVSEAEEKLQNKKAGNIIKNFLIVVLLLIIVAMLFITSQSQYSIFTYFTNYKEDMRNEIADEFEEWENQLNQKEAELEKRESRLNEQEE